jgi:hypothetical protein
VNPSRQTRTAPNPTLLRALTAAAIAAATLLGTLATAAPAMAAFRSPSDFNRAQVMLRAEQWCKDSPEYNQMSSYHGYRQDCSGFVSMAWGLRQSYVTWTLPEVAWPIHKSDLMLGDIMLNQTGADQHVVLFHKWANRQQTAYWEYELAGSTNRTVHRVVPYPFWTSDRGNYKPYRFAHSNAYTGKQPPPTLKAVLKRLAAAPAPSVTAAPAPAPKRPPLAGRARATAKPRAKAERIARTASPGAARTAATVAPVRKGTPAAPVPVPASSRPAAHAAEKAPAEPLVLKILRGLVAWIST